MNSNIRNQMSYFHAEKINTLETDFTAFHFVKEQVPLLICHFHLLWNLIGLCLTISRLFVKRLISTL